MLPRFWFDKVPHTSQLRPDCHQLARASLRTEQRGCKRTHAEPVSPLTVPPSLAEFRPGAVAMAQRARLAFPVWVLSLIAALLTIDVLLAAIHCLGVLLRGDSFGAPRPTALLDWRLDEDHGYPEYYEYGKTALLAGLALVCIRLRGLRTFGPVLLTAIVLLLDNSLQLHEQSKTVIIPASGLSKGPAEIAYILVVGAALLGTLVYGAWKATDDDRLLLLLFIGTMAILGGFGGAVDLLHTQLGSISRAADLILAFVEDGGELVTLTLACALLAAGTAGRMAERDVRPVA